MENIENSLPIDEEVDSTQVNNIKQQNKDKVSNIRLQNPLKFPNEKDLKELAIVEKQFNCDVIQEMRDLWEIIAKSAHENRFDNSNVIRVPELGDTILFYQQRAVECKPFIWRSEIINYPPKCDHILRKAMITGIAIIDSKKNGTGGEATILDGGIGASFVQIKLQSQWFKGYSFTIIIIGKYCNEEEEHNRNFKQLDQE